MMTRLFSTEKLLNEAFYVLTHRDTSVVYMEAAKEGATLKLYLFLNLDDALRYGKWVHEMVDMPLVPSKATDTKSLDVLIRTVYSALGEKHKDLEVYMVDKILESKNHVVPNTIKFHSSKNNLSN